MDARQVLGEIECFLEEAEDNGTDEFEVNNNFDSITIISVMEE